MEAQRKAEKRQAKQRFVARHTISGLDFRGPGRDSANHALGFSNQRGGKKRRQVQTEVQTELQTQAERRNRVAKASKS